MQLQTAWVRFVALAAQILSGVILCDIERYMFKFQTKCYIIICWFAQQFLYWKNAVYVNSRKIFSCVASAGWLETQPYPLVTTTPPPPPSVIQIIRKGPGFPLQAFYLLTTSYLSFKSGVTLARKNSLAAWEARLSHYTSLYPQICVFSITANSNK